MPSISPGSFFKVKIKAALLRRGRVSCFQDLYVSERKETPLHPLMLLRVEDSFQHFNDDVLHAESRMRCVFLPGLFDAKVEQKHICGSGVSFRTEKKFGVHFFFFFFFAHLYFAAFVKGAR